MWLIPWSDDLALGRGPQLEDGASYVAATQEPFRKMDYTKIVTLRQRELTFKHKAVSSVLIPGGRNGGVGSRVYGLAGGSFFVSGNRGGW